MSDKVEAKKKQIVQRVTQHMVEKGLADIGLRTLAAVGGTSDRMLIYYFETKDGLIGEALHSIAADLSAQLDALLGDQKRSAQALLHDLLIVGTSPQFQPVIQLWFEVVGLAARGQQPYAANATSIARNWIGWVESRLEDPQAGDAVNLFAEFEGRLMLTLLVTDVVN